MKCLRGGSAENSLRTREGTESSAMNERVRTVIYTSDSEWTRTDVAGEKWDSECLIKSQ